MNQVTTQQVQELNERMNKLFPAAFEGDQVARREITRLQDQIIELEDHHKFAVVMDNNHN